MTAAPAPARAAALAERDRLVRAAAARWRLGPADLAAALAVYSATGWPKDRLLAACPAHHRDRLQGDLFAILRAWPHPPGAAAIAAIIGDHAPGPLSAAERQRRLRQRRRAELAVFTVELPEAPVLEALIQHGFIGEAEAEDRPRVVAALSRFLREAIFCHGVTTGPDSPAPSLRR